MTSFSGPPEFIDRMLGLPEEKWFRTLDDSPDWSALVSNPVGDLTETERVFRTIWSASHEIVRSKPREFLGLEPAHTPEARATTGALRAIGATRLAEIIESDPPSEGEDSDVVPLSLEESARERERVYESRAARRAWNDALYEARSGVRQLLIRYLTARGVFPLEPHDPLAADRAIFEQLRLESREQARRNAEKQDARDRLQPFPPEKK
jgi:hypothetical protein